MTLSLIATRCAGKSDTRTGGSERDGCRVEAIVRSDPRPPRWIKAGEVKYPMLGQPKANHGSVTWTQTLLAGDRGCVGSCLDSASIVTRDLIPHVVRLDLPAIIHLPNFKFKVHDRTLRPFRGPCHAMPNRYPIALFTRCDIRRRIDTVLHEFLTQNRLPMRLVRQMILTYGLWGAETWRSRDRQPDGVAGCESDKLPILCRCRNTRREMPDPVNRHQVNACNPRGLANHLSRKSRCRFR